jgi:hypothetical protein
MKVKLERGINEKGVNFFKIFINEEEISGLCNVSRILTNTDSEGRTGIWSIDSSFAKGENNKIFYFDKALDIHNDRLDYLKQEIIERSKIVREWVNSLPYKEEIEFTIPE